MLCKKALLNDATSLSAYLYQLAIDHLLGNFHNFMNGSIIKLLVSGLYHHNDHSPIYTLINKAYATQGPKEKIPLADSTVHVWVQLVLYPTGKIV